MLKKSIRTVWSSARHLRQNCRQERPRWSRKQRPATGALLQLTSSRPLWRPGPPAPVPLSTLSPKPFPRWLRLPPEQPLNSSPSRRLRSPKRRPTPLRPTRTRLLRLFPGPFPVVMPMITVGATVRPNLPTIRPPFDPNIPPIPPIPPIRSPVRTGLTTTAALKTGRLRSPYAPGIVQGVWDGSFAINNARVAELADALDSGSSG